MLEIVPERGTSRYQILQVMEIDLPDPKDGGLQVANNIQIEVLLGTYDSYVEAQVEYFRFKKIADLPKGMGKEGKIVKSMLYNNEDRHLKLLAKLNTTLRDMVEKNKRDSNNED